MYLPNSKSVALPVPEIIGDTPQIGESLDTPTVPFLEISQWAFARMDPVSVSTEFEVRGITRS